MDTAKLGADRLFQPGRLSLGLSLPFRTDGDAKPEVRDQIAMAILAEEAGFDAVWVRDVPLNGDWYPEPFGHPDPFATLGAIAASTHKIALGTAATVLTIRHPLHVAKAAITLDHLSGGRFVLGLGSGDRPQEFAAFDVSLEDRKALFQSHWSALAAALERPARVSAPSSADHAYALIPTAQTEIIRIAVGSSGQTLEWIARNASGWATYHRPAEVQQDRHALWRRAVDRHAPGAFRSFSVAMGVEILKDPDAALETVHLGVRGGVNALLEEFVRLRTEGVHHLILNLSGDGSRQALLETLSRHVLEALGD